MCLTNPPWREGNQRGIRSGCRVPNSIGSGEHTFIPFPFPLAYATAVLERSGVETLLIDAVGEDSECEPFLQRIEDFAPELVVIEMATQSHDIDLRYARLIKTRTGASIAVCGSHPTALPAEILASEHVDYVLRGEYEQTLLDLVLALGAGRGPEAVQGVAYRRADGGVETGGKRELVPDLDAMPWPHRETLPLGSYRAGGFPLPVLFMYASRGCPYLCNFCLWPQWFGSGSYRVRSPRSVVDEIEHARQRYGPFRSIYFDDDTFNIGRPRMLAMADEFERRRVDLPWGCHARADLFDEETMRRLAEVGLFNIRIGVESGDPEVLKRIKKNLDLDSVGRCIDLAHRLGIKVHVTFTIGLSGETWESVERTVKFAKSIDPDSIAFTITTPFPGTSYYDEVVRDGHLETRDWSRFNAAANSVVRTAGMSAAEIERAERYVKRKVYYSPRYLLRRARYARGTGELGALARKGMRFLVGSREP